MPNTTPTPAVLLCLFLLLFTLRPLSSTDHHRHRRILHQPFQPQDSVAPTNPLSPTPPPPPTYPFSSSTPDNTPFFPFSYPSPPPPTPPSPASFASFPANISSLSVPSPTRSNSASSKLVIAAVAAVGASVAVVSFAVFLHLRRRAGNHGSSSFDHCKTQRSDNSSSVSFNQTPTGLRHIPKLQRPSQTSSEFLYLGTLVSAHAPGGGAAFNNVGSTVTTNDNNNGSSDSRETDSPDLRPLPPLNTQQAFRQNLRASNRDLASSKEDESEEFYSPKGSINGRESSIGTGSASRRPFAAIVVDKFNESTSNSSSTYSSSSVPGSGSGSPVRSVSLSLSPANNISPRSSIPKSPDLIEIQAIGLLPAQMPPPAESSRLLFQDSSSPSPASSSSPERKSRRNEESVPRVSNVSDHNFELPVNITTAVDQKPALIPTAPEMEPDRPLMMPESEKSSPRTSNVSENVVQCPLRITRSPEKHNAIDIQGPPLIEGLPLLPLEYEPGLPLVPSSVESPLKSSSRILNLWDQNIESPAATNSPARQTSPKGSNSPYKNLLEQYLTSEESSPRTSIGSDKISSPVRHCTNSVIPAPPPPPPLPPSKLWGRQETPAKKPGEPQPVLIKPFGMVAAKSPTSISPIELPLSDPQLAIHEEIAEFPNKENELSSEDVERNGDDNGLKPKLKPLHWDKVRASSDREMVWDQFKSSSFKLNEEMIETLFVVNTPKTKPNPNETTRWQVLPPPGQDNGDRVLDPKKSQNVAILLKALHVTVDEVCEGLLEGNADILGTELLESLLKMAPTKEEELKLKECKDDSPVKLGAAERFLKAVVDIPFAFKRVEAMLYMSNFDSEVEYLRKSFATLEAACEELRNSRMFLKLLEAVLKTGNRMNVGTNRGDAHAFKLDTLLKLVDVKAADGKTTLLHFVVHEIVRSEGSRLLSCGPQHCTTDDDTARGRKLGLPAISSLGSDLSNVKRAAAMDADVLAADVSKLSRGIETVREIADVMFLLEDGGGKFVENVRCFVSRAEGEIFRVRAEESLARSLVKEITEYFHGNSALEGAHPFRIFMVVKDFLGVLDRVCREVGMVNERTVVSSAHRFPVPVNPMLQPVSGPGVQSRQGGSGSSGDNDDKWLLPFGG